MCHPCLIQCSAGEQGFMYTREISADSATTIARQQFPFKNPSFLSLFWGWLVLEIEPISFCMQSKCSTTDLCPQCPSSLRSLTHCVDMRFSLCSGSDAVLLWCPCCLVHSAENIRVQTREDPTSSPRVHTQAICRLLLFYII